MKIIHTIHEMYNFSSHAHRHSERVALVPTMGYLHEGHLSLIDEAHNHADIVVVSIFVNPTQFAPDEDLEAYPRDFEHDRNLCELHGVNAIFAPTVEEMYPVKPSTWVDEDELSGVLCGKSRPSHFRGVTTVVAKLFNAVIPDVAVFGEKDYQQACIIKKMVADLNFHTRIVTVPIVREDDGLAMSSRNKYLSEEERKSALSINTSLKEAEKSVLDGEKDPSVISAGIELRISQNGGKVDYVEIMDPELLTPVKDIDGKVLIAVAAFFGNTRLIDNIVIL